MLLYTINSCFYDTIMFIMNGNGMLFFKILTDLISVDDKYLYFTVHYISHNECDLTISGNNVPLSIGLESLRENLIKLTMLYKYNGLLKYKK